LQALLNDRKMKLVLTDKAKDLIAELGWDPQYGARPLKRTIQRMMQDPLAQKILAGEFKEGDAVTADAAADNTITFTRE
jgi:ATP-dependent Clp protease ATP-binding subunit ClpB